MKIFDYQKIKEWIPYLLEGIGITLLIALVAAIFGLIIGIVLVLMTKRRGFKRLASIYIDIFRGTPLLLQLSIVYFALPQLLNSIINNGFGGNYDFSIPGLLAVFITFSLNSGAYISEIIRSGINSVDKNEIEAATSLGVSKYNIYKDIIIKIAFKNSFPALVNELTTLIKESSIASIIGIADLMRRSTIVSSQTFMYFEPLIVVGIVYYILIKVITLVSKKIEVRMSYDKS
ncbi:MAG: amino acid ABC transporter permease [Candidatus Izemoplasmatales bacterium]|nr:amino acid ABC transporter permease [Candidatus Izemoplasmatales bacterium]